MNEPTTAAGRTLVKAFVPAQGSDAGSIPLRPATVVRVAVPRIEAEARADLAKRIEERVAAIPVSNGSHLDTAWNDAIGSTQWWHECHAGSGLDRAAVVAIVREEVAR